MHKPLTSLVTITFNNYDELVATCKSIEPISKSIEHVVINGGQCAKSKQFLMDNPLIVGVSERDHGIADAFNKGILKSNGKYVIFVNSGDLLINDEYISQAEKVFESQPNIDFIFGNLAFQHPQAGSLTYFFKPFKRISAGQPYFFPTMIFRRIVFEKVGLFNTDFKIGMDFDLIVRLQKQGAQGFYLNLKPVVMMDGHGVSSQFEYRSILENEKSLVKHGVYDKWDLLNCSVRKLKYLVKSIMTVIRLEKIIFYYKKIKYSNGSDSK